MRLLFCLVILCLSNVAICQKEDSTGQKQEVLPGVNIVEEKPSVGLKQEQFNLRKIENLAIRNFSELLQYSTTIHVKNYGSGLSTLSFRGTGAQHTNLYWNGIPINSPALGLADYSSLNVGLIDDATVHFGNGTSDLSAGGLGGAIALNTGVSSSNRAFTFSKSIGSFGESNTLISVQEKIKNWKFKIRGNHNYSNNNFKVKQHFGDSIISYNQENANSEQFGVSISAQYSVENHLLSLSGMLTDLQRELPSPIGVSSNGESQSDNTKAFSLQLKSFFEKGKNSFVGGVVDQDLIYKNPVASIRSRLNAKTFFVKDKLSFRVKKFNPFIQVGVQHDMVENNGYSDLKMRTTLLSNAGVTYESSKIKTGLTLKTDVVDGSVMPLSPDLGLEYRPLSEKLLIEVKASKNYRLPTLNDLYWFPGGNENLKTEQSLSGEFGISSKGKLKKAETHLLARTFVNEVDNWIIWLPKGAVWSPENVKKVLNSGLELQSTLSLPLLKTKGRITIKSNYAYTKAITKESNLLSDASLEKQLIFVPEHQVTFKAKIDYQKVSFTYGQSLSSKSFINSLNTAYMPYFAPAYLKLSYQIDALDSKVVCSFQVHNLFNEEYQVMPNRPMPGQHYSFNLAWRWNEN